jgi:hypothetical protein
MPKDNYLNQKKHIIPKGKFDLLRNRAAGPGRLLTLNMINEILSLGEYATSAASEKKNLMIHLKNKAGNPKKWNEELYLRDEDKRPACEFAHFPKDLFTEMSKDRYSPQGLELLAPTSFTFYLAYSDKKKPDAVFSARFPVKGVSGQFVDQYYGNSEIPKPKSDQKTSKGTPKATIHTEMDDPSPDECSPIAATHSIRSEVFQQCLSDYWGEVPVPEPYLMPWTAMYSLITDPDNKGMQVRLLWDDAENNNDMDLGFEQDPYPDALKSNLSAEGTSGSEYTSYSFKLFFGINYLNETFQLRMYKGQNADGSRTILIESIGANGHNYYDINGIHP